MGKIGGGWITSQEARPDEEVTWSRSANRMQGSRGVGGKLFLTNQRILFSPHRIDALTGGKQWSVESANVSEVGVEPKGSGKASKLGGGLRDRLRIRTSDGGEELFVINKLEAEVLPKLREAVSGGQGGAKLPPAADSSVEA